MYQACVRSVMLYGNGTWAVKEADLLWRMIRWMCNVTFKDRKPSLELRECLGLDSSMNCIRRGVRIEVVWPCREMQ